MIVDWVYSEQVLLFRCQGRDRTNHDQDKRSQGPSSEITTIWQSTPQTLALTYKRRIVTAI